MTDDGLFLITVEGLEEHLALANGQLDALGSALPLRKLVTEGTMVAERVIRGDPRSSTG
jgi:hypothetical protein